MEATKTCHFCSASYDRGINTPHWTGTEYVRIMVCSSDTCRGLIASAPRKPRQPRTIILDAGGWANIPGLNRAMSGKAGR
jgi:hypothetical protein